MDHVLYTENGQTHLNDLSMQVFEGEIYGILRLERHGGAELFKLIAMNEPIQNGYVFFRTAWSIPPSSRRHPKQGRHHRQHQPVDRQPLFGG